MPDLERVTVYDRPYRLHSGELIHQYQAWCHRCLRTVDNGSARSPQWLWQTKRPAVAAGKRHLQGHAFKSKHLDRMVESGADVVELVTL